MGGGSSATLGVQRGPTSGIGTPEKLPLFRFRLRNFRLEANVAPWDSSPHRLRTS